MKKAPTCNTICSYYWFLGVQTKGAIYTMRDASCHIESGLIGLKVNLQVLLHCCTRLPRATSKWVPDPLGRASLPDRELVHQGKQRHFSDNIPMRVLVFLVFGTEVKLTLHSGIRPTVRCPCGNSAATAMFACQWFSIVFLHSPSIWADGQRFGVAATAMVLSDRSRRHFCGSSWQNPWWMSKFNKEINVNNVNVCYVSKAFSTAYGRGTLLGSYCTFAIAVAVFLNGFHATSAKLYW